MSDFYCAAPWDLMYYHLNSATPCHCIRTNVNMSPVEYLNSDWLKNLKKDFVEGRVPSECFLCHSRESMGLKSTRLEIVKNRNYQVNKETYPLERETKIQRLEIRSTNLCNFSCRMCDEHYSSEISREREKYPVYRVKNVSNVHVKNTDEQTFEELKKITLAGINRICLTGGEPLLIKQYYDFMDHLIDNNLNEQVSIELFSNCSVYNPSFVDRLMKFKEVDFTISVDGVGKTAEYIRHGTKWKDVSENMKKFVVMPKTISYNTAISAYTLLDVSSLAKFLLELYNLNNTISTKCYSVIQPKELHFNNLNSELRLIAVKEITDAIEILQPNNFDVLKKELGRIKNILLTTEPDDTESFRLFTEYHDAIRKENFEDVFGYKLK
jgi:organic radical activating enzyme